MAFYIEHTHLVSQYWNLYNYSIHLQLESIYSTHLQYLILKSIYSTPSILRYWSLYIAHAFNTSYWSLYIAFTFNIPVLYWSLYIHVYSTHLQYLILESIYGTHGNTSVLNLYIAHTFNTSYWSLYIAHTFAMISKEGEGFLFRHKFDNVHDTFRKKSSCKQSHMTHHMIHTTGSC